MMKARGLDHLVLAVKDLDEAGRFYERLGFKVGQRNRHPWGTENRIVQFPGIFLELITIGADADRVQLDPKVFSFGGFIKTYLDQQEGFAMLVLASDDAARDRQDFLQNDIGDFAPFHFERQGMSPDGKPVTVAFSLAFARDALAPDIGYFVCQHHFPENFWSAAAQAHPNHANALTEIALYAENPADHAEFMSAFTGLRDYSATSFGLRFETRGAITILSKPAYHALYGPQDLPHRVALAGISVAVPALDALSKRFDDQGISYHHQGHALVVPASFAHGACLRFVASSSSDHSA